MCAQKRLTLVQRQTGLRVVVLDEKFPLIKILLSGQADSARGIEVEFPEHVTGVNESTHDVQHLYLVTNGDRNRRSLPVWKSNRNELEYATELNDEVTMVATLKLDSNGVSYLYKFFDHSNNSYENFQAVTCVKLFSDFSDTRLERTYVHHANGFDLLGSETPERLILPMRKWLPCRYLVSYTWPVPLNRIEKDADSVTRYYKSRKADRPFIATVSHDGKWIAATCTSETGNLWTNPERSCQHADPSVSLKAGETKTLRLKTFIMKGSLEDLLRVVDKEQPGARH
jgi:hypothetical protein